MSNHILGARLRSKQAGWKNGGAEQTKLEPSECGQILEELENWTAILKAEPEVIQRLEAFADAAQNAGDEPSDPSPVLLAPDAPEPSL